MPTLFFADLVRERSTATGASALALEGALPGHRRFADAVPPAARFHYSIAGVTHADQWEVGEGRLDAAGALIRTPHASSNNGAPVDLLPGLKTIALTVAAPWFTAREAQGGAVAIGDIAGLDAALAGKQPLGNYQAAGNYQPAGAYQPAGDYADRVHSHAGYWQADGGGNYVTAGATKLGVGTVSPAARLHVAAGPDDARIRLSSSGDGANADASIDLWATHPGSSFTSAGIGSNIAGYPFAGKRRAGNAAGYIEFLDNGWMLFANAAPSAALAQRLLLGPDGQLVPAGDATQTLGAPYARWAQIYAANGTIATSDRAAKRSIGRVPERWLDAWGDVGWSRYRMKGGKRWHIGLVAQDVHQAFAARGLDAFELGLLCCDVWAEERAPVISKKTGRPMPRRTRRVRASGERWGLRYDECLAMEAAWVRRELDRLGETRTATTLPKKREGGAARQDMERN